MPTRWHGVEGRENGEGYLHTQVRERGEYVTHTM